MSQNIAHQKRNFTKLPKNRANNNIYTPDYEPPKTLTKRTVSFNTLIQNMDHPAKEVQTRKQGGRPGGRKSDGKQEKQRFYKRKRN